MKEQKKEWQNIQHREVEELFDMLTGSVYYPRRNFVSNEVEPDLVIKWRLPDPKNESTKTRSDYKSINTFVSVPSPQLETAYELAQKKIMYLMNQNGENLDSATVKIRYFKSIQTLQTPKKHQNKIDMVNGGDTEDIEFQCFDEKNNTLDGFTLYVNSIMYMLQRVCGLKVRAFMINSREVDNSGALGLVGKMMQKTGFGLGLGLGSKISVRDIYFFLNISIQNQLKVASRFQIKKVIDYSILDFNLNDPATYDDRPIKLHSKYKSDKDRRDEFKSLSRYFKIRDTNDINTQIIDEAELSLLDEQKFRSYWEQSCQVFDFLKTRIGEQINNQEKVYLYEYNRSKINLGCEKILSVLKKRRQYFQLQKQVCKKYEYNSFDEPQFYEEFILPNKKSKGGFLQKLRNILAYKANFITPYGDQGLFNSMQRSKLCYLQLKSTLKVNALQKQLNMDIFSLNNEFQKSGQGGENQKVSGGLDGQHLIQRWYIFALFSDIRIIRSYFGDVVAHEIMIKITVITYLFALSVPYLMLFIMEQLYKGTFSIIANLIETLLFVVSFSLFSLFIQEIEDDYIRKYSDNKDSKVFSNQFVGPYIRNILTDQLNQFQDQIGFFVFLRNLACLAIFFVLAAFLGGIFHGSRMFLLSIYDQLFSLQSDYFSMSHLIAYSIYLILGDIFKIHFYDKIVAIMIYIKNPSSDVVKRNLESFFTFNYLLIIEVIPIFFFFIIEPFARTTCYSVSCEDEFYYYIYARFLFNIIMAGINFVKAIFILLKRAKDKIKAKMEGKQQQIQTFQTRLNKMITVSIDESKKSVYSHGLTQDFISLFAYSFYCTELPISGLIALAIVAATYIIIRIELLYENRRPINRSQPIIKFTTYCHAIYVVGSVINIWVNTFLLENVERHYVFMIQIVPPPLNQESILLVKLVFTVFLLGIFTIFGIIARLVGIAISPKFLMERQHQKYKQYMDLVSGPKVKDNKAQHIRPTKNIFRSFNPEKLSHQLLSQKLDLMNTLSVEYKTKKQGLHMMVELFDLSGHMNEKQLKQRGEELQRAHQNRLKDSNLSKSNQGYNQNLNRSNTRLNNDKPM